MPPKQDVPFEAREDLVFTPECLAAIPSPPKFTLRWATPRDKRYLRRLQVEESVERHSAEAINEEIIRGLKALWSPEIFAEHEPRLREYWQAQEDYALQVKDFPDLKWEYDEAEQDAIIALIDRVIATHRPLARMVAQNMDAEDMAPAITVATILRRWDGLDTPIRIAGGYVDFDCVMEMREELKRIEKDNGLPQGAAFLELFLACAQRLNLTQAAEKNSESPSPSATPPKNSKGAKDRGTSPASAKSGRKSATK